LTTATLFRGFEQILLDRDPLDAPLLVQRVCGVCPTVHAGASALAVDNALGIDGEIPDNGRVMRNLIMAANFLQSHILHFYHLAALDYVDLAAVADYAGDDPELQSVKEFIAGGDLSPFVPRYEGDYRLTHEQNQAAAGHYLQALVARRQCHELLAIFGGKMPHQVGIVAGGATEQPTAHKIADFLSRLATIRDFVETIYVPDVLMIGGAYADGFEQGRGAGRFLAYGGFELETAETNLLRRRRYFAQGLADAEFGVSDVDPDQICEYVGHSRYRQGTGGKPSAQQTVPEPTKEDAYSWIKAPRYRDQSAEVGPLARTVVAMARGDREVTADVESALSAVGLGREALISTMGRHLARALETRRLCAKMAEWAMELKPGEPVCASYEMPDESRGMGLTEGPRGALGHWLEIGGKRLTRYQLVVPTTWNGSPRDDRNQPGPVEEALTGLPVRDRDNPFEVVRVVRSFDPCLACSVHLITPQGEEITHYHVV
jgi:hydrogenase large subunit